MAGATFTPDLIWEDPYFNESKPLTRRERLLWIARNVLRSDNCVAKKGEGAWSLRFLSEAWTCPKTTVERTLKKFEKLGMIMIRKCKINGTVQYVISYLFSTLSAYSTKSTGTASGTEAGQKRDKDKSRESEEEDSCAQQASHEPPQDPQDEWEDPFADNAPKADGAGHQNQDAGAGQPKPEKPKAASSDAGPPKNSAQKVPAGRKRRVPDDWRPKDATVAWARNGKIGATDPQIADQLDAFRDHHIAKGSTFADFDRAFQTWMRNAKRFGHLDGPKKTYAQQNRESEFSI